MSAPFEFQTASTIVFGRGASAGVRRAVADRGVRPLVVHGSAASRAAWLVDALRSAGCAIETVAIAHEPDVRAVGAAVDIARRHRADVVVGLGGGSVMDAAKAIGVLAANPGDVFDYLEVVGRGQPFPEPSLPVVAVPTTAGTGSEVTKNAVLASRDHRVKVSLRSPSMLPAAAIVDPDLSRDLPPALTATTGLDALTQLVEPYLSRRANPLTDALCVDGIARVRRALPLAYADGHDLEARTDMALASLFGGMALANAGLGAVHGCAGPIGGLFDAPHGAVCGVLLPLVFEANLRAVARSGDDDALARFNHVATLLTGRPHAAAQDAVDWLGAFVGRFAIPRLGAYGMARADVPAIAQQARHASSMKANPVELTTDELSAILTAGL